MNRPRYILETVEPIEVTYEVLQNRDKKAIISVQEAFGGYITGDLALKFPDLDYDALSILRLSNWSIFKAACDRAKTISDYVVALPSTIVEMYKPEGESIEIEDTNTLTVSGGVNTEISFYPFTPTPLNHVFNPLPGSTLTLKDTTYNQPAQKKYESYQCVLKKDSNLKKVELLGEIRPEFWGNLTVGKIMFYGWASETAGVDNTIASWDEATKTIFLTNNISGSVSNNMSGDYVWFGTYFEESISLEDYNEYGNFWISQNDGLSLIYRASSGGNETIIRLEDVTTERFDIHLSLSSTDKITLQLVNVHNNYAQIASTLFTQNVNARSSVIYDNLEISNCGYLVVGGRGSSTAGNILGSGYYLHPNVVVQGTGLNLHDNLAGAFRQYSSSGIKPVNPEDVSIFNDVVASGNVEYDLLLSNSMPTIINNIVTGDIIVGNNLVINGATVSKGVYTTAQNVPESGQDYTIELNNLELNGVITMGWPASRQNRTALNINDLIMPTTNTGGYKISSDVSYLREVNIDGVSMLQQDPVTVYVDGENRPASPTYADGLISPVNIAEININGLTTDRFWNSVFVLNSSINNPIGHALKIRITDSELLHTTLIGVFPFIEKSRYISDMVELTNTLIRNDIGRRTITVAFPKITPIEGTFSSTKSIDSTLVVQDPAQGGVLATTTLNDVLHIDFEHDRYNVNSGTIKHIAPTLRNVNNSGVAQIMTMSAAYNGDLFITAVGGSVVFDEFNSSTNTYGNILNPFTLLSGQTAKLTSDRKHVFSTAADTTMSNVVVGTGDGVTTAFPFNLANRIITPATVSIVAGSVNGVDDGNGNITGTGISYGFIDYLAGTLYIEFSVAVSNAVQVFATYNIPSGVVQVGGWTVELE